MRRQSGKVSNLVYSDFDTDPQPALQRSVKLSLRTREIDSFDFTAGSNPPVLHGNEMFLASHHPLDGKFARLTHQEQKDELLDDSATIGTKEGWQARLSERDFTLRGHRLVRQRATAKQNSSHRRS
jgi:DNA phosphorothioation-associated putative methyltransferase